MISGYTIGNFQAFGAAQHVPVKPITLIFGPNGAGKSSLLKALLVAQQAIRGDSLGKDAKSHPMHPGAFEDYARFSKAPVPTELHSDLFPDYANDNKTVRFIFAIDCPDQPDQRVDLSVEVVFSSRHFVHDLIIRKNGKCLVHWSVERDNCLVVKEIDRAEFPDIVRLSSGELEGIDVIGQLLKISNTGFLPREWLGEDAPPSAGSAYLKGLMEGLSGYLDSDDSKEGHTKARELRDSLLDAQQNVAPRLREMIAATYQKVIRVVEDTFKEMVYHGPLRPIPVDFFDTGAGADAGLLPWKQLASDHDARKKVNLWLSSPAFRQKYRVEFDGLIPNSNFDRLERLICGLASEDALARWGAQDYLIRHPYLFLERMTQELARAKAAGKELDGDGCDYDADDAHEDVHRRAYNDYGPLFEQAVAEGELHEYAMGALTALSSSMGLRGALHDARWSNKSNFVRVNLVDVNTGQNVSPNNTGVGFSQMLPILASAYGSEKSLIVVEQPELHIHPALQAELADVFIESALGPNQNRFLLETHSEHLILRVLRRIRETSAGNLGPEQIGIRPEDIAILYVKPGKEGSEVVQLAVTPDGDFSDPWPDGFFPDRAKELF